MPKPSGKTLQVILEREPAKDAEARLRMAFSIILSGISIKPGRKSRRKSLTIPMDDVK